MSAPSATFFQDLERERTRALVDRDLAAIERLHAPDYELVTPAGRVFSRERYLKAIAAEPFYAAWEHGEMNVLASERMAVIRYPATLRFPSGKVVECWHLDVYELRDDRWQAVRSQATEIAKRIEPSAPNLATLEMKAFVPARKLAESMDFYRALGFEIPWHSENMAYVHHGKTAFLLQEFYVPQHADNFMMHLLVENADDWHRHILASGVVEKYATRIEPPEDRDWGLRDFPFVDPTGVLWRVGHDIS